MHSESRSLGRHPAAFHCQAVTDCGEGALASCLDMEAGNAERGETACGRRGMDGCRRAWPLDKESDSCYRGLWEEGGVLLEADRVAPLFTLTPGLQEARGGHMPNSPGGQNRLSLPLTSLPAPPSPARYMSVCGRAALEAATLLFSKPHCRGRRRSKSSFKMLRKCDSTEVGSFAIYFNKISFTSIPRIAFLIIQN